ncbi:capsid cement protein [Micromonospora chersina]|uniref:capsid cement protein n=1 Tax=Micromonospora chersina TaxID=47854 RepID=UPI00371392AA
MAKNQVFDDGDQFAAVCTDPATPVSGDPVIVGQLPGVALINEEPDGKTTIKTNGVYNFPVKGVTTAAAGSAVAAGDIIYYVPGNTPKLSKATGDAGAVRFGYALGAVASGATGTIPVKIGY